jgi:hypothetical protein
MSDTPRTKAATRMAFTSEHMVEIEEAQKMERDLADALTALAMLGDKHERELADANRRAREYYLTDESVIVMKSPDEAREARKKAAKSMKSPDRADALLACIALSSRISGAMSDVILRGVLNMPLESSIDIEQRHARILELTKQRDALAEALPLAMARAYERGYQHGHEDTVESKFVIVHANDALDYFADDVRQMLLDGSQPEAQKALAAVKGGSHE